MARHITVNSKREAWEKANELFPTDYEKNEQSSANAGYPIYTSTAKGNESWISDTNVCLELTIVEGDYQSSETIYIDIEPKKAVLSKELFKGIEAELTEKLHRANARMNAFLEDLDETDVDEDCSRIVKEIKSARADIKKYAHLLCMLNLEATF